MKGRIQKWVYIIISSSECQSHGGSQTPAKYSLNDKLSINQSSDIELDIMTIL